MKLIIVITALLLAGCGKLHDVEAQIEHRYWREDDGFDPLAATRRAITRAAAEIGKGMK